MEQQLERSPPAKVQYWPLSYVGRFCCWSSPFFETFSLSSLVLLPPALKKKISIFQNSIEIEDAQENQLVVI